MIAFLRSYGWALASGVLMSWALPNFHGYPLAWLALVPLLTRSLGQTPGQAAAQFFAAGWIFHTIVLQWLMANIFWAGGWAVVGQQGICLALAGYWALMGILWSWLNRRWPGARAAWLFGACWISMEWLQARLFTGFAWAALGYSQGPDLWFAQLASLGGVILVSGILVVVNALLAQAFATPALRWRCIGGALVTVVIAHGVGYGLLGPASQDTTYSAGMYQSNYSQQMKWDPDFQDEMLDLAFAQTEAVLSREPASVFVWPEALIMDDFREPDVLSALQAFAGSTQTPLFAGAVRAEGGKSYNSSVLVRPDGTYEWYDKIKLAPFGEYIPLESWLSFMEGFGAAGGQSSGADHKVLEAGGRSIGPLICFEVLFSPLASKCRALGADYLVVITNLGWFGLSNVLAQELELARFRAIENRLPLVQCANSGISGVFDAYGRLTVIDGFVNARGGYAVAQSPQMPSDAKMHRRAGALPVPEAGRMLLPGSVDWFGRILPVATLLLLCWGYATRNRRAAA
jgi:apolipoprotein N-acyltransferase